MADDRPHHPRHISFADPGVPPTAMRVLKMLDQQPGGFMRREMAAALDVPVHLAGVALWWLRARGDGVDCAGMGTPRTLQRRAA